jgi:tRNA(Ile2) C34 agmatinyltransferase TiaS
MPTGDSCPECGGRVRTDNGTDYECRDCGRVYDSMDLFLP